MKVKDKIKELATVENAKAYAETSEKFTFCIDILGISAWDRYSDEFVELLEDEFDKLNGVK